MVDFEGITSREFGAGEAIFREGDHATGEAYLVQQGSVEIRRRIAGEDRPLRVLTAGALLGEVSLFQDAPHSATAVATTPVTVLVIPAARLEHLVRAHPELAMAIIRELARMAARADAGPER